MGDQFKDRGIQELELRSCEGDSRSLPFPEHTSVDEQSRPGHRRG